MDKSTQGDNKPIDLSELKDFQFGAAWAFTNRSSNSQQNSPRRPSNGDRRPSNGDRRPSNGERPTGNGDRRPQGGDRRGQGRYNDRFERPVRELPQAAEGLLVELRPANNILEIFSTQIQKQKRALPLLDLAKLVMANTERYDIVFMKLEDGQSLIHSKKGDNACWLSQEEAISQLWIAAWFAEYYTISQEEVAAPKGSFSAIAKCSMGGEIIGPVNWHGYQAALIKLNKSKYARMDKESFRSKIQIDKSEEAVNAWLEQASKKTVWSPTRDASISFDSAQAVEEDFLANHYTEVYEISDKVFVNAAIQRKLLSPGLAAHVSILGDKSRRFPQMIIANLCHGLARHHLPIYKWQGKHYTGPSRIRTIPADIILADRMSAIVEWAKKNSGNKVDEMFALLTGVPAGTDEVTKQTASDSYAPYVADMIWLLEQGFLIVTSDNSIWHPKTEQAPKAASPKSDNAKNKRQKGTKTSQSSKAKEPKREAKASPAVTPAVAKTPALVEAATVAKTPALVEAATVVETPTLVEAATVVEKAPAVAKTPVAE